MRVYTLAVGAGVAGWSVAHRTAGEAMSTTLEQQTVASAKVGWQVWVGVAISAAVGVSFYFFFATGL